MSFVVSPRPQFIVHIFISHAVANAELARSVADALEDRGATTFLSSRAGDIRADEDWLPEVERALQESDAYLVLLTPESISRAWVNFEAGAAWFSGKQLVFAGIRALAHEEIPLPVAARQVYALDDPEQLAAILDVFQLATDGAEELATRLAAEAADAVPVGIDEVAWEGVQLGDMFFAWAGPLLHLEDRAPEPPPAGLLEAIEQRGFRLRWGNLNRLPHHIERGLAQVFATDRERWRRPIVDRDRLLLVRPQ